MPQDLSNIFKEIFKPPSPGTPRMAWVTKESWAFIMGINENEAQKDLEENWEDIGGGWFLVTTERKR